MSKTKPSNTKELILLMTAARDVGAISFKFGGLEVEFAPPKAPVIKFDDLPPELQIPSPADITTQTTRLAEADLIALGFSPSQRKPPENLADFLKEVNTTENEALDEGLFIERDRAL